MFGGGYPSPSTCDQINKKIYVKKKKRKENQLKSKGRILKRYATKVLHFTELIFEFGKYSKL